jgi:hypothetical protein
VFFKSQGRKRAKVRLRLVSLSNILFTDEYFSFGNKKEPNSVSFPLKLGGVNWRVFWYPISQRRLSNNVFARIDYVQKKRTQHLNFFSFGCKSAIV